MPPGPVTKVPRQRTAAAAVVLSVALFLGALLTGCEYQYPDDHWNDDTPAASVLPATDAALPQDPGLRRPVTGAELDAWARQVLPEAQGQVFHTGYGSLDPGVPRSETTTPLPQGSYSLTLACRSSTSVSFIVSDVENDLVDLSLRCGTSRVNVIYLSADAVLTVTVNADAPANFAYRVTRI